MLLTRGCLVVFAHPTAIRAPKRNKNRFACIVISYTPSSSPSSFSITKRLASLSACCPAIKQQSQSEPSEVKHAMLMLGCIASLVRSMIGI